MKSNRKRSFDWLSSRLRLLRQIKPKDRTPLKWQRMQQLEKELERINP